MPKRPPYFRPGTPSAPALAGLSLAAFTLAALLAGPAHAEQAQAGPTIDFDIPAQPLNQALLAFGRQSGRQIVYRTELTDQLRSQTLRGSYGVAEALRILLNGAPLHASGGQGGQGGAITLERRAAPAAPQPESRMPTQEGVVTLPTVKVTAADPPDDPQAYNVTHASAATKTDTPLMETPLNIQVIPKAVLDDQQTIQLAEALKNVSGVTTSIGSGGLSDDIFLRGFRTSTYFRNGFRVDSQYASIGTRQMANVERLEVVKGPASVMYGRMEPGGMVNVVTKVPLATPYYSLQQQFGSYGLFRTSADATGPITADDTLLYRFNASFESASSFRELVDNQRIFLAPIITWNIGPQTQASLEMEYRHDDLNYDTMAWPYLNGEFIKMPISRNLMERTPSKVEEKLIGFNWSHQFNDDWNVKQRFVADLLDTDQAWSYASSVDLNPDNTLARSFYRIPGQTDTYFTTLDLTGHVDTWGVEHTLLVGGDFYRTDQSSHPYVASLPPIDINNPVHDERLTSAFVTAWNPSDNSANYFGAYAQDQIKLPYGVHVMGGFRYQYVKQWDNLARQDLISEDKVNPRAGLLWQPRSGLSLYGNYVENFGVSNQGVQTASGRPLPPQSAKQWEGGVKLEFFSGRLSATFAYFDLTKQNVVTRDPNDPSGVFSVAAGEVNSRGPEIDIRGEVLPGWNLIATYANWDTRVTKDNGGLQGSRLYAVPRNVGSLWSTYAFQPGAGMLEGFKFGGGVTARDGTADGGGSDYQTAGYATVDLLAAYAVKLGKAKLTTQLNVNNLLDKEYFTDVYLCGACSTRSIGTPRTFLGSLKVEF